MTFPEAQVIIEKHYKGQYEPYHAEMIELYLISTGISFDEAIKKVMMNHPVNFALPDISVFVKVFAEIRESYIDAQAQNEWNKVVKEVHFYKSITFKDVRTCYAFNSIGGINGYCNRSADEMHWMKKEFISAFKKAEEIKGILNNITFRGNSDNADKDIIFVGYNEAEKAAMIENKKELLANTRDILKPKFSKNELKYIETSADNDIF